MVSSSPGLYHCRICQARNASRNQVRRSLFFCFPLSSRSLTILRALAFYILDLGEKHHLSELTGCSVVVLIGGFIMLRFFCPAITLPNSYGIVPENQLPSPGVRRNLTLITKVLQVPALVLFCQLLTSESLQKMSNGELFDEAEPYLKPMNKFIHRNSMRLNNYLVKICEDPLGSGYCMLARPLFSSSMVLIFFSLGLAEPFADVDPPVSFEVLHFKEFDMKDLFFIHRVLDRCAKEIILAVQSYSMDEKDGVGS